MSLPDVPVWRCSNGKSCAGEWRIRDQIMAVIVRELASESAREDACSGQACNLEHNTQSGARSGKGIKGTDSLTLTERMTRIDLQLQAVEGRCQASQVVEAGILCQNFLDYAPR